MAQLRQAIERKDLEGAVKIYEHAAGNAREAVLKHAATAPLATRKMLAQVLHQARDFSAAGRAFELAKQLEEAAASFEACEEFVRAAECWKRAGQVLKAAASYSRAGRVDEALTLYDKAKAPEEKAECLARAGRFLEAARIYRTLGNVHAEAQVLRAGMEAQPYRVPCAIQLAELLLAHDRAADAVKLLTETAEAHPTVQNDRALLEILVRCLEVTGAKHTAERVRARVRQLPEADHKPLPPPVPSENALLSVSLRDADEDAYSFLKAMPLFADLSLVDMKALYRISFRVDYQAGETLIEKGEPGRGLLVILQGVVEVRAGKSPTARLLNTLGQGGYIGEISLVQESTTSARVTARTQVKALFISRESFLQYTYSTPAAALRIWRLFVNNLAERVRVLSSETL